MNKGLQWLRLGADGAAWMKDQLQILSAQAISSVDSHGEAAIRLRWSIDAANFMMNRIDEGSVQVLTSQPYSMVDLEGSLQRESTFSKEGMLDWLLASEPLAIHGPRYAVVFSSSYYASGLGRWKAVIDPPNFLHLSNEGEGVYGFVELDGSAEERRSRFETAVDKLCQYPPQIGIAGGDKFDKICSDLTQQPGIPVLALEQLCLATTRLLAKSESCGGQFIAWTSDVPTKGSDEGTWS